VRQDDMLDTEASLHGSIDVDVDIALRVDHCRDTIGSDQVRGMCETA